MAHTAGQRRACTLTSAAVAALALTAAAALGAVPAAADKPGAGHCARIDTVTVEGAPSAPRSPASTTSRRRGPRRPATPNPADWAGLRTAGTVTPSGVPGIQVDGYFPDTSTSNTNHGWNHDSQFVIRIPDDWNGKVVISGAPEVRGQYANDLVVGDWVLAQGYAFAPTDKGNPGASFWDEGPNLFTYRPTALKRYPAYAATGDPAAHDAMIDAGFAPGSEFLRPFHYSVYWDVTQRWYREELDPTWDGALKAGVPLCASGTASCDADHEYASRPRTLKDAVRSIELTGRIGRPLVTIHGTLDTLLPIGTDSDVHDRLVDAQGAGERYRYYCIADGTHTDGLHAAFPDRLRPQVTCATPAPSEAWTSARVTRRRRGR